MHEQTNRERGNAMDELTAIAEALYEAAKDEDDVMHGTTTELDFRGWHTAQWEFETLTRRRLRVTVVDVDLAQVPGPNCPVCGSAGEFRSSADAVCANGHAWYVAPPVTA